MKRILTLATLLLLATITSTAQVRFTVQAGESIRFTRTGYYTGYEQLQSTIRLQVGSGLLFAGAGYSFVANEAGTGDLSLRAGLTLTKGRFSGDAYAILQHGLGQAREENPTLGGAGTTFYFKIAGPVHVMAEYAALYPFFPRNGGYYGYYNYKGLVSYLTLGAAFKF